MKNLIGYGSYSSGCSGHGCTPNSGYGCTSDAGGCVSTSGLGQTEKIAGMTPFAWVMVALAAGTLAYLVGQKD
jgi:hypothetical protein